MRTNPRELMARPFRLHITRFAMPRWVRTFGPLTDEEVAALAERWQEEHDRHQHKIVALPRDGAR